ncbi:MAG TPA: radical SAM protein, partial [Patescibacteria group bacterium]|nr:radical SAM protein [Patescibacteria group bacterium]
MLKYLILTIGCQMNKSDSERLAAVLENIRFAQTEKEAEANLIFVNACSVRQSAIDRIFGKKKKWNKRRETGDLKTFLLGCVLPKDKPKMENFFDAIFDIKDIVNLPKILRKSGVKFKQSKKNGQNKFAPDSDYFHIAPSNSSKVSAFVPIMRGCDHFCAYCAVPYAKGPEISRPARDIANEAKKYIKQGFKEITLLGQNVNSYGLIRPRWKMVDEKTKKIYPPESWILD